MYENAFIIAPKSKWGSFYAYRKEYPDASFSLHTQEDVESLFSYHHDDRAVIALLKEGYSYEESQDILSSLARVNEDSYGDPKLDRLVKSRDQLLEQGLLWKQEYPERSLAGHCLIYHGYPDTTRTRKILDHIGGNFMVSAMQDSEPKKEVRIQYHRFSGIYEELHYVYNRIGKLLEDGVSIDDIYLYGVDQTYSYLLPRMSEAYGFSIETPFAKTLDLLPIGIRFLKLIQEKDLEEAVDALSSFADDPNYQILIEKIEAFTLSDLSKKEQIQLYQEVLRGTRAKKRQKKNVVHLLKEPFAPEDSHIFFVDFSLGKAPGRHADEGYLSDDQKRLLHQMTSQEEGSEEKANLKAFLLSGHIDALCYHQIDLDGEKLLSALVQEPLDPNDPSSMIEYDPNNDLPYEYSKDFLALELAHLKDLRFDYRQEDSRIAEFEDLGIGEKYRWKTYDSQYKPFQPLKEEDSLKISYSRIDNFYKCPFRYYLENILGLNEDESSFVARRGSICHRVMEWMHDPGFEFEDAFDKAMEENQEEEGEFSPKEKVLMDHARFATKKAVEFLFFQEAKMKQAQYVAEYSFPSLKIAKNTVLNGMIDKVILTGDSQQYLTLVDYKSYTTSFDPKKLPYGLGMQLPTYALAVEQDPKFQDKDIIGLFIQPIGLSSLTYDTIKPKKGAKNWAEYSFYSFQIKGAYTVDPLAIETLTGPTSEQTLIASSGQKRFEKAELEEWVAIVKEKYEEAEKRIRSGDFPISPVKAGFKDDGCSYCRYRDICYLRESMNREIDFGDEEDE